MIPRYRTMKGYQVPRKAGWDTHGLPVELEVEKQLGLDGKEQIEAYGLDPFIRKCKENVWKYKGMWEDFSGAVGFWADVDHPYVTYDDEYIESEWWALHQIWEKGLLYKGFKIVPYCPRCGTPLSNHEVAQGYQEIKEKSAIVRFRVKATAASAKGTSEQPDDTYILAWTTTPWTLPSNVALCVNPQVEYAKVKAGDGYTYYLAKELLDSVLGRFRTEDSPGYEIVETLTGKEMEGMEYEPLMDCAVEIYQKQNKKAFYVVCAEYVTVTDGTGVVHIAPAFGEDDAQTARLYDLPFAQLVDTSGLMTKETPYEGVFCKKADPLILRDLQQNGFLFDAPPFEHSYPHCWRCDTPLIYYARDSWFIRMSAVKEEMIANNHTINWVPESMGKGRFGDWLENIQDWSISRNRYWGTPLNIWICDCGHQHAVESRAELIAMSGEEAAKTVELHRPYIDEITLQCPICAGRMKRVPEVIDCWFDSGAMPFAQHHYPFENQDLFEKQFPAQFISEAVDQTRGWFYTLLAESTLLFGKSSFENVIVLGHVLDENGQKMSKSKGNAVDPMEALETYGADAIRWYYYASCAPWLPKRFSGKIVTEGQRKFMGTLWNTYAFLVLYANIDGFDATKYSLSYEQLPVMDRWLLSRLHSVIALTDRSLEAYAIPEATRALSDFVDEMSNWYVRRSRERFWAKGMEQDKINAYMTLYIALVEVCKLAAPMIPFMTEAIYQNLVRSIDANAPESIHLCDYPVSDDKMIDEVLEMNMRNVLETVVMGRACRNNAALKNRQPLALMIVKADFAVDEFYQAIIREELNIKELLFTQDVRAFTTYQFKPQLRTVGPKYGKLLGGIQKALSLLDGNQAMDELEANGRLCFSVENDEIELTKEDLLITMQQKEGYISEESNRLTVVLDANLTDDLIEEGYVYEMISKIQTMRKDADFEVTDHIRISVVGNDKLIETLARNRELISGKVLADEVFCNRHFAVSKEWNINGEMVTITLERIANGTQ
jgi:isoleucyl-tRNA synthetase